MQLNDKVQHVYLVGAKSLGAYGGYETFVYKLTEYHQNKENIKYHVACKANGDGCMDESKFEGVTKINDHEFELHNAHCFKIDVPQIGPAQAIYYDVAALKTCCEHELYAKGIAAGALGGKLLGAGGGGFLVFYVQPERQDAVRWAMRDLLYIPFQFEDGGTRVIHYTPEDYVPKD